MPVSTVDRVKKYREALRAQGLRPVQIWVPDTHSSDFAVECQRQAKIAAEADHADNELDAFMDDALSDIDGWSE